MSADVAERRAPIATGTNTRQILASSRVRIAQAVRENDRETLRDIVATLGRLTVHYLVHGGGPAHDVAIVADEAIDGLNLVVAKEAGSRSGMHGWGD